MPRHGRWRCLAVGLTVALTGCGHLNGIRPPSHDETFVLHQVPDCARNHVYVFFIHGMDPLDAANLRGVHDYVRSLGFIKTYYGQVYHKAWFEKEVVRLHQEDPDARFVLVGFSLGANKARDLTLAARKKGITVDLLVYMGGNTLDNVPDDRPDNALRIVNVLAKGCIWNGATLDGAENVNYTDVYHFGSPSHLHTLDLLREELAVVAGRVPVVVHSPPVMDAPAVPQPSLPPPKEASRDEWDFLKPDSLSTDTRRTRGVHPASE